MPVYAAFLGHQPHISTAELAAAVPGFRVKERAEGKTLLFESAAPLDPAFLHRLGGTVVLAEELPGKSPTLEEIPSVLLQHLPKKKGKVTFALRTAGLSVSTVQDLLRQCKKKLKDRQMPSRYVGNPRKPALPVVLHDAGVFEGRGCELTLIQREERLWVGKTVAAQDIDAYTKRDIEKPVRDTWTGLLPPKLAQILLNFGAWLVQEARQSTEKGAAKRATSQRATHSIRSGQASNIITVYDPFCGTGVIPMECLLRGWTALASDLSQRAVSGCEKNLEWLRKEMKIAKKDVPSAVWKHDALKPFVTERGKPFSPADLPDAIVTETSLGPALESRPNLKEMMKLRTQNEELQAAFLRNAAATLPGVPIVATWPVWYAAKEQIFLEKIWKAAAEAGFRPVLPPGAVPSIPGRLSLLYRRPDQFVGREIVLLRAK